MHRRSLCGRVMGLHLRSSQGTSVSCRRSSTIRQTHHIHHRHIYDAGLLARMTQQCQLPNQAEGNFDKWYCRRNARIPCCPSYEKSGRGMRCEERGGGRPGVAGRVRFLLLQTPKAFGLLRCQESEAVRSAWGGTGCCPCHCLLRLCIPWCTVSRSPVTRSSVTRYRPATVLSQEPPL